MIGNLRKPDPWWTAIDFVSLLSAACPALAQLALRLIPEARPGIWGVACWYIGMQLLPLAAAAMLVINLSIALAYRPFWRASRVASFLVLGLVILSAWTFTVYPSSHDGRPSKVAFRLPLDGPVTVSWGGRGFAERTHVRPGTALGL